MIDLEKIAYLIDLKKTKIALDLIQEALSIHPTDYKLLFLAGVANSMENRDAEAEEYFLKALEFDPESYETYNQLSIIAIRRKNYKNLEFLAAKSIELNPNQSHAYFNLAQKHLKTGNLKAAKENCDLGLQIEPESTRGIALISQLQLLAVDSQAVITTLRDSLQENPNDVGLLFQLGVNYYKTNNSLEATKIFKECLRLEPDNLNLKSEIKKSISSNLPFFKSYYKNLVKVIFNNQTALNILIVLFFILSNVGLLAYNLLVDFNWIETIIALFLFNLNMLLSIVTFMNNLVSIFLIFHPLGRSLISKIEWLKYVLVVALIFSGYILIVIGIKEIWGGQTRFTILNFGLFLVFVGNMIVRLKKQFSKSNFNHSLVYLLLSSILFLLLIIYDGALFLNYFLLLTLPLTLMYSKIKEPVKV